MSTPLSSAHAAENRAREEIARIGADLYQRRYTVGSAGNISARLDDGWLITPTDACLGHLDPARIAKVDRDGEWTSGDKPSKTLALHRNVYDCNPAMHGVVHTHSTHLVALTLAGVWQPAERTAADHALFCIESRSYPADSVLPTRRSACCRACARTSERRARRSA